MSDELLIVNISIPAIQNDIRLIQLALDGHRESILSTTLQAVNDVVRMVGNAQDILIKHIEGVSENVKEARDNINGHITLAINDINEHTDESTNAISRQLDATHKEVMGELNVLNSTLSNLGSEIGDAIADSIKDIVAGIENTQNALVTELHEGQIRLEAGITRAIELQGEAFALAINNAADSIDGVAQEVHETRLMLKEELELLRKEIVSSIDTHAKTFDRAIRDTSKAEIDTLNAIARLETSADAALIVAINAMSQNIVNAIVGSTPHEKQIKIEREAKGLELLDYLLPIMAAIAGLIAVESPEAIAKMLVPVIDAYFNIGKAVTKEEEY